MPKATSLNICTYMTYLLTQVRLPQPVKTADISWRHLWFPRVMTSEKRAQKFHADDLSLPRLDSASDWLEFSSSSHKQYPNLGVTRHQYRIYAVVSQTSLRGETRAGVTKCRLFSQATITQSQQRTPVMKAGKIKDENNGAPLYFGSSFTVLNQCNVFIGQ